MCCATIFSIFVLREIQINIYVFNFLPRPYYAAILYNLVKLSMREFKHTNSIDDIDIYFYIENWKWYFLVFETRNILELDYEVSDWLHDLCFSFSCVSIFYISWGNWRTAWESWTRVWHKNEAGRGYVFWCVHILLSACVVVALQCA